MKRVSEKLSELNQPVAIGLNPEKQTLDFGLGLALFKDGKVSVWVKAKALFFGALVTAGLGELEHVLMLAFKLGHDHVHSWLHWLFYIVGLVIFSVLSIIWQSNHSDATRLRYERHGVIPIKEPKKPDQK